MSETDIKETLRGIMGSSGVLYYSRHTEQRMKERGYSYRDVACILEKGDLIKTEYNEIAANWKYTFHCDDLEGDSGTVVIAILKQSEGVIITVLSS